MSDSFLALADLLKINGAGIADKGCSDILNESPVLMRMAATEASNGTVHSYLKETTAPTVGFRAVNAGRDNSKSADTQVDVSLKILDCSFAVDKALADAYKGGVEAFIAREARRHIRQGLFAAEKQMFYGTGSDSGGFTGLANQTYLDKKDDSMVIDATGSTANTGSSVWFLRTNNDGRDIEMILPQNGLDWGDSTVQRVSDGTATYPAYYTPIMGWMAMAVGSLYSAARICNLTADSGKGMTDTLAYAALTLFPASRMPNLIVMNRRSLEQLRKSRTATNATGAPAPRPTEIEGIPIVVTDAILSTEALLAANS